MMTRLKQLALAALLCLSCSSCLGPNNTFNDLHEWNKGVSNSKWVNEGIFFGLNVVPVYAFAYLADIIVMNSIEFWGGDD